jgi:FMN phosphatase YigB (HAD superfamily)
VTNAPVLAVCLDAGNTLIHCDPPPHVIYADHLSRHGRPVPPAEVGVAFREAWDAAAQAGLQSVLIDRHGLYPNEPWRRIASLAELLDMVL